MELQTEAVNYLRNYSDLKALCLVSKQLSDIATARLFCELDLSQSDGATNQVSSSPTSKPTHRSNHKNAKVGTGGSPAYGSITTSTQARFSDEVQVFGFIDQEISYATIDAIHLEPSKKPTEPEAILIYDPGARFSLGRTRA